MEMCHISCSPCRPSFRSLASKVCSLHMWPFALRFCTARFALPFGHDGERSRRLEEAARTPHTLVEVEGVGETIGDSLIVEMVDQTRYGVIEAFAGLIAVIFVLKRKIRPK